MAKLLAFKKIFRSQHSGFGPFKFRHFLNTLSQERLDEILLFSEGEHFLSLLPESRAQSVLFFNDQRHKFILKKIVTSPPPVLINYVYGGGPCQKQSAHSFTLMGSLRALPFKPSQFDLVICPFGLDADAVNAKLINDVAGLLKNGGRLVLSLRHPQLEYLLFNQNPAQTGSPENSISRFFDELRKNHLYTEVIKEGMVALPLKPYFNREGERGYYHEYKGTPLTLFFRAVKFVR